MKVRVSDFVARCDAPNYRIVRACHEYGFERPEDVRWQCHAAPVAGCCGDFVSMTYHEFTHKVKGELVRPAFFLGQCPTCFTIFWGLAPRKL